MKVYTIIAEFMYCTASFALMKAAKDNPKTKAVIEWDVKTQGKNFHTFAEGKYIYDVRQAAEKEIKR